MLQPGEQLTVAPGQHVVMEAGAVPAARSRWLPLGRLAAPLWRSPPARAARDWECGVVQPLRAGRTGAGTGRPWLGTALAGVAGGRLGPVLPLAWPGLLCFG